MPAPIAPVTHNQPGSIGAQTKWHQSTSGKVLFHTNVSTSSAADNLNLAGTSASYSASLLGSFKTITIDVGGRADVVKMSSKLTDAELVAADQVLSGGSQTLSLNARGAAAGGSLILNSPLLASLDNALGGSVNSITIPKHVTVDDNLSTLNLSGDLVNLGALVSQSSAASGNTINAASISNAGSISSGKTDLTLNAPTITNSGSITSGSNLNLGSGVINNAGGTMSAGQAINVTNPGGISITGGNMLSQTLNLNAGSSALNVNGTNITGVVNDTAGSAHINATSQNFVLGNSNVSGDPLFSSTGNFTIGGNVSPTNGNALSIIAGGSIFSAAGAALNTSSNSKFGGGQVLLVAGANFTVNPATGVLTITQTSNVNGGSATGGSINLTGTQKGGAPITQIDTAETGAAGGGGSVTMVAYAGTGAGSGTVSLPTGLTIQTGIGSQTTGGGAVTVIAGALKGTSISLGNIDNSGGFVGAVDLSTAMPIASIGGVQLNPTGSILIGGFGTSTPLAVQPANVVVGNITANGNFGQGVNIVSGGTVTFNSIDTSGFGGVAGATGAVGGAAGAGGQVTIDAQGSVTGHNVLTYGGGGGGGGGGAAGVNGGAGGAGGAAGAISIETFSGSITLTGQANASGGGGGGGGGGFSNATKAGSTKGGGGGAFGTSNSITLSTEGQNLQGAFANPTKSGLITVTQGIFAINGANGGKGGNGDTGTADAGSGGGGGGSYGGGGGGGAGGLSTTLALVGVGGGGGGGYFGGGGGDTGATQNGASGGGGGAPGTGPVGTSGGLLSGGNGAGNPLSGGSLKNGGLTSLVPAVPAPGANGASVVAGTAGSPVFVTTNTGIGTLAAPQSIFSPNVTVDAVAGSVFATFGGDTTVNATSAVAGTISLIANGNLTTGLISKAATISLTTNPDLNGNIALNSDIVATKSLTATTSGTGTVTQAVATDFVSTPLMVVTTETGSVNLIGGNTIGNFQFNTAGAKVNLQNNIAMNVLASTDAGVLSVVTINDLNSPITISGNVNVPAGTATFNAGTNVNVKAGVTAPGGDTFVAGNGTITVGGTLVNPGPITFTADFSTLGKITLNSPQVTITANGASITDLYNNVTTLTAAAPFGLGLASNPAAGAFSFSSAGTNLIVPAGSISGYTGVTLANTSATGGITLGNTAVNITGLTTLSTVGGNITTTAFNTVDAIQTANLVVTTKTGNMTELGGGPFSLMTSGFSFIGSPTSSIVNVTSNEPFLIPMAVTAVTANSFSLTSTTSTIGIAGNVAANVINITTTALNTNIFQSATKGVLTGQDITLNAANDIGIANSTAGLTTTFTGAAPLLDITANNANIQSATAINLGTSTVNADLNLTSKLAITQSGTVTVNGLSIITAGGFTQTANSTFNGAVTDMIISAKPGTVVIDGTFNDNTSLSVVTPVTGTVTVNAGGVIDAFASSFVTSTVTLAPQTLVPNAGIIETSNVPTNAVGSMSFSNPKGNFAFIGTAGKSLGTLGASASLSVTSGGNITFSPNITYDGTSAETIAASTTKGIISLASNTITILPAAFGQGGTLNLTGSALQVDGAAPTTNITFNASAAATGGPGGTINVTLTGKSNATIDATPTDAGALNFIANGVGAFFAGGSVSLTNTNGLIIWTTANGGVSINNPGVNGGNGGNLSLSAGTGFNITGSIATAPGSAPGALFGNVVMDVTGGKGALNIENGSTSTNFITGTISGGNVTITDTAGITIGNTLTTPAIVINPFVLPAAPTLTLNTGALTFATGGTITDPSNIAINNSAGNLAFTGVGGTSFGTPSGVTVNVKGNVSVPTQLLNLVTETSTTLIAGGTLTLPVNSITVQPLGGTGDGGTIFISSAKQNFVTGVVGPLNLIATGGTLGTTNSGGTITYNSTGGATIDVSTTGNVTADISSGPVGGGTTGGTFNVTTKGLITLDNGLKTTTAGTVNNSINLDSTGNGVVVTANGAIALNSINFGELTIDSNSASAFSVVTALPVGGLKNGMVLAAQLTVGNFTIDNLGGGVTMGQEIATTLGAFGSNTFAAQILAKGNIADTFTAGKPVVTGFTIELNSSTGNVGSVAQGKTPGVVFVIDGTGGPTPVSIIDGKAGVVNVQDLSANGDSLVSSATGATYLFTSGGSIQTLGSITAGTVTLAANPATGNIALGGTVGSGKGVVTFTGGGILSESNGTVSATTISFNVGTMSTPIFTNATAIAALSQVTGLANPTINIVDSNTKGITLPALSTVNAPGTISITAPGNIVVTGNIGGGGVNAAQNTSLIATGKGTITESTGVTIEATNLLTLEGASLTGTAKGSSILVNTGPTGGLLQLASPGAISITDSATAGVSIQSISGTVKSFSFTSAGAVVLNSITASGAIAATDASAGASGGITTNAGTQLVSNTSITLTSTNATGVGAITVNGNAIAPIVNITSGNTAGINLGGTIGQNNATVILNANTSPIIQTGSLAGASVNATTFEFTGSAIEGLPTVVTNPLITNAQIISQVTTPQNNPTANTQLIDIQDTTGLPVTITTNAAGNSLATNGTLVLPAFSIIFATGGNLTVLGAVNPGAASNVSLTSGQSMTLDGNVGVAAPGSGNQTIVTVGNNGLGTGTLTQAAKVNILGDNVNLNSFFAINGNLGLPGTPINTQATTTLTVNETGDGVIANNSGASAALLFTVPASRSINLVNTGTAGGTTLTIGNVAALSNGGGAIVISNNGPINVGTGGKTAITGNSVDIFSTGTGVLGNVTVNPNSKVTSNIGNVTITAGGALAVGTVGGAALTITANNGNLLLNTTDATGTVTVGDNVNLISNSAIAGTGNISIISPTTLTINGAGTGLTMNAKAVGNIDLQAAGSITTAAGGLVTATAKNGNITVESTGANVSLESVALNAAGAVGGAVTITASTTVNVATTNGDTINIATNGTNSGFTESGTNVTMGNAAPAGVETIAVTAGNVNITATATGLGATGIVLGTNAGDPFTINTLKSVSNQGNITLTSAESVTLGSAATLSASSLAGTTSAGNITITGKAAAAGTNVVNIEGGNLTTNTPVFGTASGNITINGQAAVGTNIAIGSVNPETINELGAIGNVTVTSNNNLTVSDKSNITAAQSLSLIAGAGTAGAALTIGAAAGKGGALTANNGNILLQTDASSVVPTGGTITIGTKYNVIANATAVPLGNVTFAVDAASGATTAFVSGPNYTVTNGGGGGSIAATTVLGVPQFTVLGLGTTFKANFANLTIFNNGSGGAGAITFDGTNAIQADPPAPVVAPVPALQNAMTLAAPQQVSTGVVPPVRTSGDGLLPAATQNLQAIPTVSLSAGSIMLNAQPTGATSAGTGSTVAASTITAVQPLAQASNVSNDIFSSLSSFNAMANLQTYGAIGSAQTGAVYNTTFTSNNTQSPSTTAETTAAAGDASGAATQVATRPLQGAVSKKVHGGEANGIGIGIAGVKELRNGALLLAPEKLTEVVTPFGTVQVAARALALVVSTESGLSVYDLDDCHRDSIRVQVNDQTISLAPGRHVTITDQAARGFEHVNPAPYIGYRNVRSSSLNGSLKAYQSEFHHMSAIVGLEPLREMIRASDARRRKVGNHLLKTVSVLTSVSASSTPYELMTALAKTAMNR
jgi:hypothetical protein